MTVLDLFEIHISLPNIIAEYCTVLYCIVLDVLLPHMHLFYSGVLQIRPVNSKRATNNEKTETHLVVSRINEANYKIFRTID